MPDDFSGLEQMTYSGRGITLGTTPEGNPFVGYTLTGRSPSSQARKLVYDATSQSIRTDVTDLAQLQKGNPALLLYSAMQKVGDYIVASNGAQTRLLVESAISLDRDKITSRDLLVHALGSNSPVMEGGIDITSYEPDAPNFTSRINGCIGKFNTGAFYIIRKDRDETMLCLHDCSIFSGTGLVITTYKGGNENPLLPYVKEPMDATIESNSAADIAESLYRAIGPNSAGNFRVAAAAMVLKDELDFFIINRTERGE